MAIRKTQFVVGNYYHIFNRGVDKRKVFLSKGDLYYFLDNLIIFNRQGKIPSAVDGTAREREKKKSRQAEPLVTIVAFAVLPNHFHLILKEITPGGISKFMQKTITSYVMFFNKKYERSGALFQGRFKNTEAKDLVAMSSYVNLNFVHHGYDTKNDLVKTSFFEYVDPNSVKELICDRSEVEKIIKISGGIDRYKNDAKIWSRIFVESHQQDKNLPL